MAWMSDEKYEYIKDVKDKAFTARSAINKKDIPARAELLGPRRIS